MPKTLILFAGISILSLSAGCSSLQTKTDPAETYTTDSGFKFRFPMSGDWFPGPAQAGLYMVGQKPSEDGSSKVAIVRHGPIHTPAGKPMSSKAMLEGFLRDIEAESKGGRVTKIKNSFTQKKHQGADCVTFMQSAEDNTPKGPMNMTNEGMICLHPQKPARFVWMAISERWPLGKAADSTLPSDKKQFFETLEFVN